MWQLIKQVLHSFKHSILLIFSLIFISAIIIFSSFSSLYLGTNIYNSTNYLNVTGNKSDAIVEENYQNSKIEYTYQIDANGNIVSNKPAKAYKINKDQIKNDGYDSNEYAAIFPYTSDTQTYDRTLSDGSVMTYYSFTSPSLNGENPYAFRSPGMMLGYGGNPETGQTSNVDLNNNGNWVAKAFAFKNKGEKITNFDYISINPDTKKISSYFNESFVNYLPLISGTFSAKNKTFNQQNSNTSKFLDNANGYSGTINGAFMATPGYQEIPINDNINYGLLDRMPEKDVFLYLNSLVIEDTNLDNYTEVDLSLNMNSLSEMQKYIFENYFDEQQKNKYSTYKVIFRNAWINYPKSETDLDDANITDENNKPSNDKLREQVDKVIQSVNIELEKELSKYNQQALTDLLKQKEIVNEQQKSFVITDQKTSTKYIVAQKGNNQLDKIVYTEGTKLNNSTKYLDVNDLFKAEGHIVGNKKYLKNYVRFLQNTINVSGERIPNFVQETLNNLVHSFDNMTAVNDSYYNFIMAYFMSDLLYSDPSQFISFNRQGLSIEYRVGGGLSNLWVNSSFVSIDKHAYSAIVSDGFLKANNKSILPNEEWKKGLALSPYDFVNWVNNLDPKYYLDINSRKFIIIGTGISPEMAYPSTAIESPIPNIKTETVLYVNENGYQTILSTAPTSYQYKYRSLDLGYDNNGGGIFSILSAGNKQLRKNIDELNKFLKPIINKDLKTPIVYSLDDFNKVQNLITLRTYFPNQILYLVISVSLIIIAILIALGLYLSYLLIKGYIVKNQVQLAIIKANGFSSISITLSIALFGLFCSIIAGVAGYFAAYALQYVFYQLINPYWFTPIALLDFSALGLIGGTLSLLVVFAVFTFIIIRLTFRKPINQLITQNVEMKSSRLLHIMRKPVKWLNPLVKFRIGLSFSNIWRTIFFTALCSIGLSSLAVGLSIPDKFYQSNHQTSLNKHYNFKFGLTETTEQSGLYKLQEYSNFGFTDLSQGLYPIYEGTIKVAYEYDENGNPIYIENDNDPRKLTYNFATQFNYPYKMEDTAVYDFVTKNGKTELVPKRDKFGNIQYFGNLLVPSYTAYTDIQTDANFYQNTVMTKWLLDFTIPGLNINPWEVIKNIFPTEVIVKAETQDQIFLKAVYENQELRSLPETNPETFINYENNLYVLDANSVIGNLGKPEEIGFKKEFLKFIGAVYGNEELSNLDVKLSYGIIPFDKNTETYTSVNSSIYKKGKLSSDNATLLGINPESQFITLVDTNGNNLNQLLDQVDNSNPNSPIYSLVLNEGSAYKYKLDVGDIVEFNANKGYFYYSQKIANDHSKNGQKIDFTKKYKFKVVGISSASYNEEFYTSQSVANIVNGTAMNFTNPDQGGRFRANRPFNIVEPRRKDQQFIGPYKNQEVSVYGSISDKMTEADIKQATENKFTGVYLYDYVPFNGIISNSDNPIFLNNAVTFQSTIGMWNQFDYSSTDKLSKEFNNYFGNPTANNWVARNYLDTLTTTNTDILTKTGFMDDQNLPKNTARKFEDLIRKELKNNILNSNSTNILLAEYIRDVFGNYPTSINLNDIESYGITQTLYTNLVSTINLASMLSSVIIIPLIIVMVLVISASMLQEFQKMIIVLKTIGYSDRENMISILSTFIPIILLTILISIGIVVGILSFFQFIIFTSSAVFINSFINWNTFGIGFAVILGVLIINFVAMIILYKKQKLRTAIVD